MVNFLLTISSEVEDVIIQPTPTTYYVNSILNLGARETAGGRIYYLSTGAPVSSWWAEWGGRDDTFVGRDIEVRYGEIYLLRLNSFSEMLDTGFSMFIGNGIAWFNIPTKHPWLYPDYFTDFRQVIKIASSALNPDNPSHAWLDSEKVMVRLETPSVNVKLSNNYNGISLNQNFSVSLINNDGHFDECDSWNMFNTPARLKKTTVPNPAYGDFISIRDGYIESTKTDFDSFRITIADRLRKMNEPVCNVIEDGMGGFYGIDYNAVGKNMPVVFGRAMLRLQHLGDGRFFTGEGVGSVLRILDRNYDTIATNVPVSNGVIASDYNPEYAVVEGYANNRIGEIIRALIEVKAGIPYIPTFWNLGEADGYISSSPRINIVIGSGNVRQAINEAIKNDMAFFIQQTDGRFTIRRYGEVYATHELPTASLTKRPEKDYAPATENFFSSCIVNYFTQNDIAGNLYSSLLYDEREELADERYKKKTRKTFDTKLEREVDALGFARRLSDRYTSLKQTIRLAVGVDTSSMNLLDTVVINLNVNGRKFSNAARFIVKEIDAAQDSIVLEEFY